MAKPNKTPQQYAVMLLDLFNDDLDNALAELFHGSRHYDAPGNYWVECYRAIETLHADRNIL